MFKSLWLTSLLFLSSTAYAGSGAHGADLDADQNNTWFLGPEAIPYCLEIEPSSGLDATLIRRQIREAFAQWKAFFTHYGYAGLSFGVPDKTFGFNLKFADHAARPLALDAVELESCDDPIHQLEIRYAKDSEDGWALDSDHALGAAIRGPYDHKTFRTGGTVWISTALQSDAERKHILLHELGHVFGMPHNSTYVMYEKVGKLIQASRLTSNFAAPGTGLGTIESPSWKFLLQPGDSLTLGSTNSSVPGASFANSLPPFMAGGFFGLSLAPVTTTLTYDGKSAPSGVSKFTLTFQSGNSLTILDGRFQWRSHQFEIGPSIHTNWERKGKVVPGRFYLEMLLPKGRNAVSGGSKQLPLEGVFTDRGTTYPAIVEFPFGAVTKLFHPTSGRWFTFAAYPFEVSP